MNRKTWARTRGRAIFVTSLAIWLAPRRSSGAEIGWHAPPECEVRDHVLEQVDKLLGRKLEAVDTVDFEVTLARHDGRWAVELVGIEREGGERRKRDLYADTCGAAAEAAAVAISMAVRSTEYAVDESPPASGPASSVAKQDGEESGNDGAAAVTADTAPVPEHRPTTSRERDELRAGLGAMALLDAGSLPAPSPGLGVNVSVVWRSFRATATGGILAAARQEVPRGGGGEFSLVFGGILVCVEQPEGGLRPIGCAGMEFGQLRGEGVDIAISRSGSALWLAPKLEAGVSAPVTNRFAVTARIGAALPLQRPEFVLGSTESVFRPSSISGRASAGMEFFF